MIYVIYHVVYVILYRVIYVILCRVVCMMTGCGSLLSGFLRRLFLQVLLEDERVLVCVTSKTPMYKGQSGAGVAGRLQHPKLGVGHGHRCLSVSVHSTCGDVLAKVSGELMFTVINFFMCGVYCVMIACYHYVLITVLELVCMILRCSLHFINAFVTIVFSHFIASSSSL